MVAEAAFNQTSLGTPRHERPACICTPQVVIPPCKVTPVVLA